MEFLPPDKMPKYLGHIQHLVLSRPKPTKKPRSLSEVIEDSETRIDRICNIGGGQIDVVGKGGGFIMGPRSAIDEANPELVKVWRDFTREYGV